MNSIPAVSLKSTGFATFIFWILIASEEGFHTDAIPFILISTIPIFIICLLGIILTITPFYLIASNKLSCNQIFHKYFPYYTIVSFGICSYAIVIFNYGELIYCFIITAFFTAIQSWVWVFKTSIK